MQNEIYQRMQLKEPMKKNGVICLVIMFTSRVILFFPELQLSFLRLLMTVVLSENDMVNRLWTYLS